jgi:hypothetical protein
MNKLGRVIFYGGCTVVALTAALFLYGCDGGNSVTGPTPAPDVQTVAAPPEQMAVAPEPVVTPPAGDTVYFERTAGPGCAGTLVNPTENAKNVVVHYTPAGVPAGQADFFTLSFVVPGEGRLDTPSAQEAFEQNYTISKEPSCTPHEFKAEVQCDYVGAKGGHIAGRFESVSLKQEAVTPKPVTIEGEWSEWGSCDVLTASTVNASCHGSHQCPPLPVDGSIHPKQGNGREECAHFGATYVGKDDRYPWKSVPDGDFYLLKQATWMKVYHEKPNPWTFGSHVTACACDFCVPEDVTECRTRDISEQTCDNDPVLLRTERETRTVTIGCDN